MDRIKKPYVRKIDDRDFVQDALKRMLADQKQGQRKTPWWRRLIDNLREWTRW